jgi:hypothetical protein
MAVSLGEVSVMSLELSRWDIDVHIAKMMIDGP